ncbi:TIGR04282 family arsenosugar biosynthesis glycosyltransferase [Chlamydiota bacterium]
MKKSSVGEILIVFVKYPEPGSVKTRLGASIGDRNASLIYKELTELILKNTANRNYKTVIYFAPQKRKKEIIAWLGGFHEYYAQQGELLGQKLQHAFKEVFRNGAKKIVVIGTDCPYVCSRLINKAFSELDSGDCVIGPAQDGGYYLLGMKRYYPEIFTDIEWSTATVFTQTAEQMRKSQLDFSVLSVLSDIDTYHDLHTLKKDLSSRQVNSDRLLQIISEIA